MVEEETPRLTARGDKKGMLGVTKRARGDIPYPVLPSDSEASLTSLGTASLLTLFGTASQGCQKRGGSGVALSRLVISKKVIWEDEALLKIRGGLKEVFHGLKGQGL